MITEKTENEVNLGTVEPILQAQGYSQESINNFVELYTKAKYEPESLDVLKPEFFFDSETEFKIGKKSIRLRYLNSYDIARLTLKIKAMWRYMWGEDPEQSERIKTMNPVQFAQLAIAKATEEHKSGKKTPFVVAVFEEFSLLLSDPPGATDFNGERQPAYYPVNFISSLPFHILKNLMMTVVEVNKQAFLELWVMLPSDIRQVSGFQIGQITNFISHFGKIKWAPSQSPSNGGTETIGGSISGYLSSEPSELTPAA